MGERSRCPPERQLPRDAMDEKSSCRPAGRPWKAPQAGKSSRQNSDCVGVRRGRPARRVAFVQTRAMIRAFDKILEPDERFGAFVRFDDLSPVTLRDHYDSMAPLEL